MDVIESTFAQYLLMKWTPVWLWCRCGAMRAPRHPCACDPRSKRKLTSAIALSTCVRESNAFVKCASQSKVQSEHFPCKPQCSGFTRQKYCLQFGPKHFHVEGELLFFLPTFSEVRCMVFARSAMLGCLEKMFRALTSMLVLFNILASAWLLGMQSLE